MDEPDYSSDFNDDSFWNKVTKVAKIVGREIIEKALTMYYAVQDKDTPVWAKTILIAALGYFICPIDAIPDAIPGAGYADDAGAIAAALAAVTVHIKPEHKRRAKQKADEWFGTDDDGLDSAGAGARVRPPKTPRTGSEAKDFPPATGEA